MIEYKKPHLSDLEEMQALVQEEVEKGLILPRSLEEMAKNIRSYVIATTQAQEESRGGEINGEGIEAEGINGGEITSKKIIGEENEGIESRGEKNSAEKAREEKTKKIAAGKKSDEKIIGFCALHIYTPTLAEIRSLVVAEGYRHRGIAQNLVAKNIDEGLALGLREFLVLTYRPNLFKILGFEEIEKDKIPNHKIWADCIACKHFPTCQEIALLKTY